jgi:choline dehydrogenase-like flavoprotein
MLFDLRKPEASVRAAHADVAVVGAGLAGLLLAWRLWKQGLRVIVLESGGASQPEDRHPLNEVVLQGDKYKGADAGRFRCLGGTSTRWGGAMIPPQPGDIQPKNPGWHAEWPLSLSDIEHYFRELEILFKLPDNPYDLPPPHNAAGPAGDFVRRSAKWPSFKLRNVATVLQTDLKQPGIEIWLNATLTNFQLNEAGQVRAVAAKCPEGGTLTVEAAKFVLACGAIESTRLLLLLDRQYDDRIFAPDGVLGRYFYDHLSGPVAAIAPAGNGVELDRYLGRRFEQGGMRDNRLEVSEKLREQEQLPGAFAFVMPELEGAAAFQAIRQIYLDVQRGSAMKLQSLAQVMRDPVWLFSAVWYRFIEGRFLAPRDAKLTLTLVMEQEPHFDNRISLSSERNDMLGCPLAQINWRVRDADIAAFGRLQTALLDFWHRSECGSLGKLDAVEPKLWEHVLHTGGDIFHPGGSTRMGFGPQTAVVDSELRSFRVDNLYVTATSVLPSGGSCNPSFMLMALALRTADVISHDFAKPDVRTCLQT